MLIFRVQTYLPGLASPWSSPRPIPSTSTAHTYIDLTDESEEFVERLVELSSDHVKQIDGKRAIAAFSSSSHIQSPDKSPGMAWKRTVLIPTDVAIINSADIPSSPTKLVSAGWDTASDTEF